MFPAAICGVLVVLMMQWPSDAPWGGDDKVLVTNAIAANQQHRLIDAGLGGSFGYPYGPIPSQIYQLLAMLSHDPIVLVRLHAGLFGTVTAVALLWLCSVLGVSPWLAPLTLLGPFFWFYCRLMWDNTFAIPLSTLLLAAYGEYLRNKSSRAFVVAAACAILLPLIHPMTLPLAIAVSGHAVLGHPRAFKKHWKELLIMAICATVLSGPYIIRVALQAGHSGALIPPRADALTRIQASEFPLFCGRLFSAYGFFDARGPELGWEQNVLVVSARFASLIAYPLIWLGMAAALYKSLRVVTLPALCVVALLLQSIMDAFLNISPYPHYYSGTWAAAVVLLWLGIDALQKIKFARVIAAIYGASLAIATTAFVFDIHTKCGGNVWYGPSLGSQMENTPSRVLGGVRSSAD